MSPILREAHPHRCRREFRIFRDIFSTEAMRGYSPTRDRIRNISTSRRLARAQARLGIIPQDACDEIGRHCRRRNTISPS
jgi:hypothetical protein